MAHFKAALATLSLFMFLAYPHTSHAGLINNVLIILNILRVDILGTVHCTTSGNLEVSCGGLNCLPAIGANVTVTCKNVTDPLALTVTDAIGAFKVTLELPQLVLFDAEKCNVHVALSVAQCDLLPTSGFLQGALTLVNCVASGGLATFKSLPLFSLYGGL